jgi:hypothetical protein
MADTALYTCAVGGHDWIHRPRVKPPGIAFLRFSDRRPPPFSGWTHRPLPPIPRARSARSRSRFPKLCPHLVLPGREIAIWVDSSVLVLGDVRPLVRSFVESGADVALFPHPSGRTVAEEIDFAISAGVIKRDFHDAAKRQRSRYAAAGVLGSKVAECTIIFYRLSGESLRAAGETWWEEITTFTERDQVSQPYAMRDAALRIHYWDWHFDAPNPYFRRVPHRPKDRVTRLLTGAHHLADSRLDYRMARYAIKAAGRVRRAGSALRDLSK